MASKTLSTPNARLFATSEASDNIDSVQKPRTVKNYQKSNIFDPPAGNRGVNGSDSGSETSSLDGDRQQTGRATAPSTPAAAPLKNKVPPGGYSSKFW